MILPTRNNSLSGGVRGKGCSPGPSTHAEAFPRPCECGNGLGQGHAYNCVLYYQAPGSPVSLRNITRVRWVASERALLVKQAQVVFAEKPGESIKDVIAEAMLSLPPNRRRKVDTKTVLWVREAVRALPPLLPKPVNNPGTLDAPPETIVAGQPTPTAEPTASPAASPPTKSLLTTVLIESGVEVLVGILSDPRVQLAFRGLLTPSAPTSIATDKRLVVVAGLQASDAKAVKRTYEGMLPVRTWSAEQTREQLEEYIGEARLVIGMQDQLTQAIESSLRRLGDRYVQNHGGLSGLHKRLAEEAIR